MPLRRRLRAGNGGEFWDLPPGTLGGVKKTDWMPSGLRAVRAKVEQDQWVFAFGLGGAFCPVPVDGATSWSL